MNDNKCVLIIDETLDEGVVANVAAILSMSIGKEVEGLVGVDITDGEGTVHSGLTQLPIPVLGASAEHIKEIRKKMIEQHPDDVRVFDFNNFSQEAHTYDEYISLLENATAADIQYLGIALYGHKNRVNKGVTCKNVWLKHRFS